MCVWIACRRPTRLGWLALTLFLGTLSVFPAIRLGNFAEPWVKDWAGHFYLDELVRQFLTTAIPEEWIKGVVAGFVWLLMRKPSSPLSCAAAAHCGFAIVEGLLGTFGNEGVLKVIVGRSLGATHHCSWGIIAAWFAFRGWQGWRFRTLNWSFALLFPAEVKDVIRSSIGPSIDPHFAHDIVFTCLLRFGHLLRQAFGFHATGLLVRSL